MNRFLESLNRKSRFKRNLLAHTRYVKNRTKNKSQKINFTKKLMSDIAKTPSECISTWIGNIGKHNDKILLLVGNQNVSEDIIIKKVIRQLFNTNLIINITDEILSNLTFEEITRGKLFLHINKIPEKEENQQALKDLIISIIIHKSIQVDDYSIPTQCKIIITIDKPNIFFKDLIELSSVLFIDTMESLLLKSRVTTSTSLYQKVEQSLDNFSFEINNISSDQYSLNQNDNKKYLNIVNEQDIQTKSSTNFSNIEVLSPFDDSFNKLIHTKNRTHIDITGTSGSGKTITLVTSIYSDILRADGSVLVLDPQGDFGEALAKLPMDKERIVFIDPTLSSEMTPTLNPFNLKEKSEQSIKLQSNNIISFVKIINIEDKLAAAMDEMLYHCICVLLRKGNSDFKELILFMNDNKNDFLVALGKNSPDEDDREFFEDHFESPEATKTKAALRRRLKRLMSDHYFSNLMNGKETIDLEKLMNTKGKVIILNVNKHNMPEHYKYFARFIIELVKRSAFNRRNIKKEDRVPCYFYCDEFQNYITPSIQELLSEIRQYKLYMTFSHQAITQISDSKLRDMILSLTTTKIACKNSNKTLETMKKAFNHALDDLMTLNPGEFYLQAPHIDVIKVQNSDELLDGKIDITNEQWEELKKYQLENYYRSIKPFNLNYSLQEFINNLLSEDIDIKYFEALQKYQEKYTEFLFNIKEDENGRFIAQPEMSFYFNTIYPEAHIKDNKQFLSELKSKNILFKQNTKEHKKYNDKYRYKLL